MSRDVHQLDFDLTPLDLLARWPLDRRVCLLHSGRHHERWATRSIFAEPVGWYRFVAGDDHPRGRSVWLSDAPLPDGLTFTQKPFADLKALLASMPGPWIGYLSYDLGRWIEALPDTAADDRNWPIIELAHCPGWLEHETASGVWSAHGSWADAPPFDIASLPLREAGQFTASNVRGVYDRTQYEAAVQRVIDYIGAGDVFQVNLTQRFSADIEGAFPAADRALFSRLAAASPAWYGAYLEAEDGQGGRAIASTSPELFLEVDHVGHVVTRPIKGTRPASASAAELHDSVKDTAELNMIVDLLRNDLGRVCQYGTVKVSQPRTIESHPTVHHGVATITGKLHHTQGLVNLLRATMPGGSITGAPKVRAMEIIDELEPVRRGPYCGAIGMLSNEHSCLNVAIRTIQLTHPRGSGVAVCDFNVGGGIVADSVPASEYEETLDKAAAMVTALGIEPDVLRRVTARGGSAADVTPESTYKR